MTSARRIATHGILALAIVAGLATVSYRVLACPFCSAVSLTFSEEIANSQVAVIAKLAKAPPKDAGNAQTSTIDVAKTEFEIVKVLKGEDALGKTRKLETAYFGDSPVGTLFLVMGIDPPNINWSTPIAITERGQTYITKAIDLPKEGADRLAYFQDYLEDSEDLLARDAYDEFAKTPYSGVLELKGRMKHDKLVEWIKSEQIPVSRRRLYLTMLGVCGTPADVPMLEEMIKSKQRHTALDALVAAYLTLKGPDGMPLVEDLYFKNKDAEYTDTYATIMALRFHGTEEKIIPRPRLLEGLRLMLDRPQLADLVIPDLARWEDWSVVDRLTDLFKNADEESNWIRVPVINYLRACPLPKAKERMDELAKLDPETVKRANSYFPLASGTTTAAAAEKDKSADAKPAEAAAKADAKTGDAKAEADTKADAKTEKKPATPPTGASSQGNPPATKQQVEKVTQTAAVPAASNNSTGPLAKDVAAPIAQGGNLPVMGGLALAAVLLGCAFWAILKGGQRVAS